MQINNTMTVSDASHAGVMSGTIAQDPHEHLMQRRPGTPVSSLTDSPVSSGRFESSSGHRTGSVRPVCRSAAAARQIPGPAWGSLVVVNALLS